MWKIRIINIASWIFSALPVQTILAKAFSWTISRISSKADIMKVMKTISHCHESLAIMMSILSDAKVTESEVDILGSEVNKLRVKLLETWARMESDKELESKIVNA